VALFVKDGGSWSEASDFQVKDGESWAPVQYGFVKEGGSWQQFYSCLGLNTLITMADGFKKKLKNVKRGDSVRNFKIPKLPQQEWGGVNIFELKSNMEPSLDTVDHLVFSYRPSYYKLNDMKVTRDHPFFVYNKKEDIYTFERVYDIHPKKFDLVDHHLETVEINSLHHVEEQIEVGSIGVKNNKTYFANDFLVHNK